MLAQVCVHLEDRVRLCCSAIARCWHSRIGRAGRGHILVLVLIRLWHIDCCATLSSAWCTCRNFLGARIWGQSIRDSCARTTATHLPRFAFATSYFVLLNSNAHGAALSCVHSALSTDTFHTESEPIDLTASECLFSHSPDAHAVD